MIYHLAQAFQEQHHFFNLFHYVSVRAIAAFLSSLLLSFIFGNWFINASGRYFRSKVREYTPANHQLKNDTPTMGGLFILGIFTINTLLWNNLGRVDVWLFVACLLGFGAIGFYDDWKKIHKEKGISARHKFILQNGLSLVLIAAWYFLTTPDSSLCIPFLKNCMPHLGWLLIPWGAFIITATSNAVNLTDGLDGLATGPLMFNFATFGTIAYLAGHKHFSAYLHIPFAGSSELAICAATLIGCMLGFLWYNTYPAQIFMGDVGALAFGAGLALMALMCRQELLLVIAGGIFVMETVSVIIQVLSFRYFKRRVFKMAPIHHHFELMGWNEPKITVRFWIISIILCVLALLTLKIR